MSILMITVVYDGWGAGRTKLAHTLRQRDGVDAIILAGTDLCLLFDESNIDFPHVDCSHVHIKAIMRSLLVS